MPCDFRFPSWGESLRQNEPKQKAKNKNGQHFVLFYRGTKNQKQTQTQSTEANPESRNHFRTKPKKERTPEGRKEGGQRARKDARQRRSQKGRPTWNLNLHLKLRTSRSRPKESRHWRNGSGFFGGLTATPPGKNSSNGHSQVPLWRVTMTPVTLQAFHPNRHPDDSQQETGQGRRLRWRACRGRGHCSRASGNAVSLT